MAQAMGPPHLFPRPPEPEPRFLERDTAKRRRVSHYYPRISTKRIKSHQLAVVGPFGCYIRLDEAGLPKEGKIQHARTGCLCEGHRDAIIMNLLCKWVYISSVTFQIEPEAAKMVAELLTEKFQIIPMPLGEVQKRLSHWRAAIKQVMM
ncbi:hypothetical protein PG990_014034 [Apiospora arundinis]